MKKNIVILGSTGSIGKTLLKIISKEKKKFKIILLTANKNYSDLLKQAEQFNVKNIILSDRKSYQIAKTKNKNKKLNIFNNFDHYKKIFNKKVDYVMSSIVGVDGLYPTYEIIKYTKKIAIANKESIICAWNLINKELKKNKTEFIPVDSEHFSIWYGLQGKPTQDVKTVYLTASGGSLLNIPQNKINKLTIKEILNHPNWNMGDKITIDSSTLMNKVFEVIETKKIFNISYSKIKIIIHQNSYIHAIIHYYNGMFKFIAHETTMEIPIANTLYENNYSYLNSSKIDFKKLNNLKFKKINMLKFPLANIIKKLPKNDSLYETVLVSANDELVDLFLKKKIKYNDINSKLTEFLNKKEFLKYKKNLPTKISQVITLSNYIRLKMRSSI